MITAIQILGTIYLILGWFIVSVENEDSPGVIWGVLIGLTIPCIVFLWASFLLGLVIIFSFTCLIRLVALVVQLMD